MDSNDTPKDRQSGQISQLFPTAKPFWKLEFKLVFQLLWQLKLQQFGEVWSRQPFPTDPIPSTEVIPSLVIPLKSVP